MSGSGGSTGKVSYPTHMEDIHKDWLGYSGGVTPITTDFISVMESSLTTNPLDSLSYTDPATDWGEVETEYASLNTQVDSLDATTDWGAIVDGAVAKVDTAGVLNDIDIATLISNAQTEAKNDLQAAVEKALTMIDDVLVEKAVEGYARAREKDRHRVKTQYKANMSSISAERSSAYALGLALLELDFQRELGQYEAEFSNNLYQQGIQFFSRALTVQIESRLRAEITDKQARDSILNQHTQVMLQYRQFSVEMKKALTSVLAEVKRIGFVMDSEYVTNTADINWKHSTWDLEVYQRGLNVLGGLGGGQFVPDGPSKAGSAIGGALQGAALGTQLGSVVPGLGNAVGAIGGGLLGLASGLF